MNVTRTYRNTFGQTTEILRYPNGVAHKSTAKGPEHTAKSTRAGWKCGRNIAKYGKASGVTRKTRTDRRRGAGQSALTFIAGCATHAHRKMIEVGIVRNAQHSFLASVPASWVK